MRLLLLKQDPFSEALKTYISLYPRVENLEIKEYGDFKEVRKKTELSLNPMQTVPILYDQDNNLALRSVEAIFWRIHDFLNDELFTLSKKGNLVVLKAHIHMFNRINIHNHYYIQDILILKIILTSRKIRLSRMVKPSVIY